MPGSASVYREGGMSRVCLRPPGSKILSVQIYSQTDGSKYLKAELGLAHSVPPVPAPSLSSNPWVKKPEKGKHFVFASCDPLMEGFGPEFYAIAVGFPFTAGLGRWNPGCTSNQIQFNRARRT